MPESMIAGNLAQRLDSVGEIRKLREEMNRKFDQLILMYRQSLKKTKDGSLTIDFRAQGSLARKGENKEWLSKEEIGKGEGRPAEPRVFSPAISVLKSGSGGGSGDGDGGSGDGDGRYSNELGVVFNGGWGSQRDGSGSPADFVFKHASDYDSGSVGGGFDGGGGAKSGEVGGNTLLHSALWKLLLLGTKEEPNTQREMGDYKERNPKKGWWEWRLRMFKCSPSEPIFWVSPCLNQSLDLEPLVLRRPLVDVIGARL